MSNSPHKPISNPPVHEAGGRDVSSKGEALPRILYRPNVAAVILNVRNEMLVAQRSGIRSAWQFPQGGVDPGEALEEALFREIEEEVGIIPDLIQILDRKGGYRYNFPKGRLKFGVYGGQEQVYYLCKFLGKDSDINLDTTCREFDHWRWIAPDKFRMEWVPRFKLQVYQNVLKDFFGLER